MKKYVITVSLVVAALAACDPVSERDCGVFDHPEFALWQPDDIESQVQFMSEDGSTIDFIRQAAVLNEPFRGSDGSSNDEDVVCELTSSVRLQATDNAIAITSTFIQLEQLLLPSTDEPLLVNHTVEVPSGTEQEGDFAAEISINSTRINFDPDRVVYLESDVTTEEIGGQAYEDVIRINAAEPTADIQVPALEPISAVRQIVMARAFGIVAFTDDQGREFVRVPAP